MNHPLIERTMRTGYPFPHEETDYYCDDCGDWIDGKVFIYDGEIYCGIYCLTRNTDVQYGYPEEIE